MCDEVVFSGDLTIKKRKDSTGEEEYVLSFDGKTQQGN